MSVALKAATENAAKDVLKQAKNLLSDKALCVQAAAADVRSYSAISLFDAYLQPASY
jgi:hypothetical protein